jgi:hypothetical protein
MDAPPLGAEAAGQAMSRPALRTWRVEGVSIAGRPLTMTYERDCDPATAEDEIRRDLRERLGLRRLPPGVTIRQTAGPELEGR